MEYHTQTKSLSDAEHADDEYLHSGTQLFTFSRILGDQELRWLSRIHRTIVTFME